MRESSRRSRSPRAQAVFCTAGMAGFFTGTSDQKLRCSGVMTYFLALFATAAADSGQ